jgi:hypothetical protein
VAPKINLYSSLVCSDYYSERSTGILLKVPYTVRIGEESPDCRIPEVPIDIGTLLIHSRFKPGQLNWLLPSIFVRDLSVL